MAFNPAPPPKTLLGRSRLLSPTAGIKVSPLCLGAMNFGEAWQGMMGECTKDTAFAMLDYFHENGGNFVDTSNNYQNEESEAWIGEWMASRGVRDQMVIATKYTSGFTAHRGHDKQIHVNSVGNNSKSLHLSVKASLKKLQTDYIDILYVHWWDFSTSIEEIMQSLNDLVRAGTVLYLGASDIPAWIVAKANQYARDHGLRQFVVYQGLWNAATRDFERDILPMCQAEGMALAPWKALGGGAFKTEEARKKDEGRKGFPPTENELKISAALEKIANAKGTLITSVALAYVMHKSPYVFPIVGGRTLDHLKGNVEALGLELSDEDIEEIEDAGSFDVGFPLNMLGRGKKNGARGPQDLWLLHPNGNFDWVEPPKSIKPGKL